MVKSLHFFFFKASANAFFFVLVKSYSISPVRLKRIIQKALFLRFFKVSIAHLFDNPEPGKRKYCFGEKSN